MTINNLWKPHLLVYIKAPIKQIREKIKKRNIVSLCYYLFSYSLAPLSSVYDVTEILITRCLSINMFQQAVAFTFGYRHTDLVVATLSNHS